MQKKILIGIVALVLLMTPITVTSQDNWSIYADSVFGYSIHAVGGHLINYDETTEIIRLTLYLQENIEESWMRGLAVIEILFNSSVKPTDFTAAYINDTNIFDMLRDFTLIDGLQYWMAGDDAYYDCSYLLAYVYLFPNHTVTNELDLTIYQGATYIGGPLDDTGLYPDFIPSNNFKEADDTVLSLIPSNVYCELIYDDSTTTETQYTINPLAIYFSIGIIGMAFVIVIVYARKKQS